MKLNKKKFYRKKTLEIWFFITFIIDIKLFKYELRFLMSIVLTIQRKLLHKYVECHSMRLPEKQQTS